MALPFFGRKPASAAPGAQRDARPGVEARAAQDDRPPPTELSALDFTGTDHGRALARAVRARGKVDPVLVEHPRDLADALPPLLHDGDLLLLLGAGDIGAAANELAAMGHLKTRGAV